jgi:hypothetical protein
MLPTADDFARSFDAALESREGRCVSCDRVAALAECPTIPGAYVCSGCADELAPAAEAPLSLEDAAAVAEYVAADMASARAHARWRDALDRGETTDALYDAATASYEAYKAARRRVEAIAKRVPSIYGRVNAVKDALSAPRVPADLVVYTTETVRPGSRREPQAAPPDRRPAAPRARRAGRARRVDDVPGVVGRRLARRRRGPRAAAHAGPCRDPSGHECRRAGRRGSADHGRRTEGAGGGAVVKLSNDQWVLLSLIDSAGWTSMSVLRSTMSDEEIVASLPEAFARGWVEAEVRAGDEGGPVETHVRLTDAGSAVWSEAEE